MTKKKHGTLRKLNRIITNRLTKLFAGKLFYALIFHTGRISGKQYSTPVLAAIRSDTIFIPLPYGVDTDWFLNIQTAGNCVIKIHGNSYLAADPSIVGSVNAINAFSAGLQKALIRAGVTFFAQLKIVNKK